MVIENSCHEISIAAGAACVGLRRKRRRMLRGLLFRRARLGLGGLARRFRVGGGCSGIRLSLGLPATRMLGWWICFLWLRWQTLCLVTLSCLSAALAKWLPVLSYFSAPSPSALSLAFLSFSSFHKLEEMCVPQCVCVCGTKAVACLSA